VSAATGWAPKGFPWWTSPAGVNLGFLLPIMLIIASLGSTSFEGMTVRGVWFLSWPYILLGVAVLLLTALCGWMGALIKVDRRPPGAPEPNWHLAACVLGLIALAAYVFWFKDFLLNPHLLIRTLTGAYKPDRTEIGQTKGLTSLTNVAPVFFCIYAYRLSAAREKLSRPVHLLCVVLIGFTLFRVYAWSERLALIEALLPFGLAIMARLHTNPRTSFRALIACGPFAALPALVVYFGAAEYVRSWSSDYYHGKLPFWEFAVGRISTYYVTSLNNGAGLLATTDWPRFQFEYTLEWLHKAPGVGLIFSNMVGYHEANWDYFLNTFGDPEFNNPSGIFSVLYDLGLPLGCAYFALVGFLGGVAYRAYAAERPAGILIYPMFFLTFLEVFRYPYLGTSRAFTWFLGILIALVILRTPQWIFNLDARAAHQHA
jgi:hypothetical protein